MIAPAVKTEILNRIAEAEQAHNVRVLYAVESGSRAWGFESPNSDYDVRFIYAHPKDWYLAIDMEEQRDVIEYEIVDEIDINGWDIRKSLRLFRKLNPAFIEWLRSPIVYIDDKHFATNARALLDKIYSVNKGIQHYRSMAQTNYRGYLRKSHVPLKKYFYVLRPLLSILWLEKYRTPAPIEFAKLQPLVQYDKALSTEISNLLARKKVSLEKEVAPARAILNDFIEAELDRLAGFNDKSDQNSVGIKALNTLFHAVIG